MEKGDISNEVSPRLLLVFENLLGILPDKKAEAKAAAYLRIRQYKRACNVFQINEPLASRIWDVTWRLKYSVDVITWVNEKFADEVRDRLDREDLPIAHVTYENPSAFARKIAHMPYVAAIYDPDPAHQFTFGGRGRVLSPAHGAQFGQF